MRLDVGPDVNSAMCVRRPDGPYEQTERNRREDEQRHDERADEAARQWSLRRSGVMNGSW
jgi:hypothetical protein